MITYFRLLHWVSITQGATACALSAVVSVKHSVKDSRSSVDLSARATAVAVCCGLLLGGIGSELGAGTDKEVNG